MAGLFDNLFTQNAPDNAQKTGLFDNLFETKDKVEFTPLSSGVEAANGPTSSLFEQLGVTEIGEISPIFEQPKTEDVVGQGPIGVSEVLSKVRVAEKLPFIGPVFTIDRIRDIIDSSEIINGEKTTIGARDAIVVQGQMVSPAFEGRDVTEQDKEEARKKVEDYIAELDERQERGVSIPGRIAEGVTELPAFMIEFMMTAGAFSGAKKVTQKGAEKILGRFAKKKVGQIAVKTVGSLVGTGARTSLMGTRIAEGFVSRRFEGVEFTEKGNVLIKEAEETPFKSFAKSVGDVYIENLSEIAGPLIGKAGSKTMNAVGKKFPVAGKIFKGVQDAWLKLNIGKDAPDFVSEVIEKGGWNGFLEELGEEQLGRIMRAATGIEGEGNVFERLVQSVPTPEEFLVEAGVLSVPGLTKAGIGLTQRRRIEEPEPQRIGEIAPEISKEFELTPERIAELEKLAEAEDIKDIDTSLDILDDIENASIEDIQSGLDKLKQTKEQFGPDISDFEKGALDKGIDNFEKELEAREKQPTEGDFQKSIDTIDKDIQQIDVEVPETITVVPETAGEIGERIEGLENSVRQLNEIDLKVSIEDLELEVSEDISVLETIGAEVESDSPVTMDSTISEYIETEIRRINTDIPEGMDLSVNIADVYDNIEDFDSDDVAFGDLLRRVKSTYSGLLDKDILNVPLRQVAFIANQNSARKIIESKVRNAFAKFQDVKTGINADTRNEINKVFDKIIDATDANIEVVKQDLKDISNLIGKSKQKIAPEKLTIEQKTIQNMSQEDIFANNKEQFKNQDMIDLVEQTMGISQETSIDLVDTIKQEAKQQNKDIVTHLHDTIKDSGVDIDSLADKIRKDGPKSLLDLSILKLDAQRKKTPQEISKGIVSKQVSEKQRKAKLAEEKRKKVIELRKKNAIIAKAKEKTEGAESRKRRRVKKVSEVVETEKQKKAKKVIVVNGRKQSFAKVKHKVLKEIGGLTLKGEGKKAVKKGRKVSDKIGKSETVTFLKNVGHSFFGLKNMSIPFLANRLSGFRPKSMISRILKDGLSDGINKMNTQKKKWVDKVKDAKIIINNKAVSFIELAETITDQIGKKTKRINVQLGSKNYDLSMAQILDIVYSSESIDNIIERRRIDIIKQIAEDKAKGVKGLSDEVKKAIKLRFDAKKIQETVRKRGYYIQSEGISTGQITKEQIAFLEAIVKGKLGVSGSIKNHPKLEQIHKDFPHMSKISEEFKKLSDEIFERDVSDKSVNWGTEFFSDPKLVTKFANIDLDDSGKINKNIANIDLTGKTLTIDTRPIIVRDAFVRLLSVIDKRSEVLGMTDSIQAIESIVNDKDITKSWKNKGYNLERNAIVEILTNLKAPRKSDLAGMIQTFSGKVARGILVTNLAVIGLQQSSTMNYGSRVDGKFLKNVIAKTATGFGKIFAKKWNKSIDEMLEHSPTFWVRHELGAMNIELAEAGKDEAVSKAFTGKAKSFINGSMMRASDSMALANGWELSKLEIKADKLSTNGQSEIWWSAWEKRTGKKRTNLKTGTSEYFSAVRERAEFLWQETQPTFDTYNRSANTSDRGSGLKLVFFMFRSFWEKTQGLILDAKGEATLSKQQGHASRATTSAVWVWIGLSLASVLKDIFRNFLGDDKDKVDILFDGFTAPLGVIPFFGDDIQTLLSKLAKKGLEAMDIETKSRPFFASSPLYLSMIDRLVKIFGKVVTGEGKGNYGENIAAGVVEALKMYLLLYQGINTKDTERLVGAYGENIIEEAGLDAETVSNVTGIKFKDPSFLERTGLDKDATVGRKTRTRTRKKARTTRVRETRPTRRRRRSR